jgi:hypothetical protein
MKTRFMTASVFLLALVICCTSAWAKAEDGASGSQETAKKAPGPKFVVKESQFDFGKVAEGETLSHEFTVSNEGSEPLKIISVKPG